MLSATRGGASKQATGPMWAQLHFPRVFEVAPPGTLVYAVWPSDLKGL